MEWVILSCFCRDRNQNDISQLQIGGERSGVVDGRRGIAEVPGDEDLPDVGYVDGLSVAGDLVTPDGGVELMWSDVESDHFVFGKTGRIINETNIVKPPWDGAEIPRNTA